MDLHRDIEWEEAVEFHSGQRVELKSQPGVYDTVVAYEPDMVPPIWLANDPCPRYPHELRVVSRAFPFWGYLKTLHASAQEACLP